MPFLAKDIRGTMRSSTIYGREGDQVTVIKENAGLILVMATSGDKFYISGDEIRYEEPVIVEEKVVEKKGGIEIEQPLKSRQKKKGKTPSAQTNTLF